MSTITVYSFENEHGELDSYTTQDPTEAKRRGQQYRMRVVANDYEYTDSDTAWDFTQPGDAHESLAVQP